MKPGFLLLLMAACGLTQQPVVEIKVDQAGYLADATKIAIVAAPERATEFILRSADDGSVVLREKAGEPVSDADSGDRVQALDFTAVRNPGRYYLELPGVGRSWTFDIGPDVYARTWYLAMRSYYGQRCGIAVDLGGGYRHAACHLTGAMHGSSGKEGEHTSQAGWHDAGDYGRYVVNSGITTGTLLWTWELFGTRFKNGKLDIPETGNGTPDLLNEIRWNLQWMLSMQDDDGGVWHKQTSERFPGFVMPEKDTTVSYVIGTGKEPYKGSCATGDFAAVMAIAARAYKPFDAEFAERALGAARKAWTWLEKNPAVTFQNPAVVATGAYGDGNCADERLWAAAELHRTTGEVPYEQDFLANYGNFHVRANAPPSWANVGALGLWTYAMAGGRNPEAVRRIRTETLSAADEIVNRTAANGYRVSLTSRDYVWGSNAVAANYGMQLLIANNIQTNEKYVEAARDNLHYLLGRNTFSLSWVTQVGEHAFQHPHHRPSGADENAEPWPGLLSGGPNRGRQDDAMRAKLAADLPPAKMYIDDQEAYAANEVAINWNAPLVFLLTAQLRQ